jgi:hypothetical protein
MFTVNVDKIKDILVVDDDYATLVDIRQSGDLVFHIHYKMSKLKSLKRKTFRVVTTVKRGSSFNSEAISQMMEEDSPDDSLQRFLKVKEFSKKQSENFVTSVIGDLTTQISNEEAAQGSNENSKIEDLTSFMKTKVTYVPSRTFKTAGVNRLLAGGTRSTSDDRKFVDPKTESFNMIIRQGKDPSSVADMSHLSVTAKDIASFTKITKTFETSTDSSTKLRDYLVTPSRPVYATSDESPDDELIQVVQQVLVDDTVMNVAFIIPQGVSSQSGKSVLGQKIRGGTSIDQSRFSMIYTVKFELLDENEVVVDRQTKLLDTSKHVREFRMPRKAPKVQIIRSSLETKASISIHQVDPRASKVKIYRKYVDNCFSNVVPYSYVGEYEVQYSKKRIISVDVPKSSYAIYRVVPVSSDGTVGTDFSNVVLKPKKFMRLQYVALTSKIDSQGIILEARSFPPEAVAIRFFKRNMTWHTLWALIGSTHRTNEIDTVSQVDNQVDSDCVYEYSCDLVFNDGSIVRSGYTTIQYTPFNRGYVDVSITGLNVTDQYVTDTNSTGESNRTMTKSVSFTINGTIEETSHDSLKRMLSNQGLYEHYTKEMTDERSNFSSVLSYNVRRIDLTTGEQVDYGVVTTDSFVESTLINNRASKSLQTGHKYRFDVIPLLRDPETMLETVQKTVVDSYSKREYTFTPSKSFHPISLRTGTITSKTSRETRQGFHPMSYGRIGRTTSIDIDLTSMNPSILDVKASRFNRYRNQVTWKVSSDSSKVDHFLVLKDANGVRTLVGKVHTSFNESSFIFYHDLTSRDVGPIQYVVIPVYDTYSHGNDAKTTVIFVDPDDVSDVRAAITKMSGFTSSDPTDEKKNFDVVKRVMGVNL